MSISVLNLIIYKIIKIFNWMSLDIGYYIKYSCLIVYTLTLVA